MLAFEVELEFDVDIKGATAVQTVSNCEGSSCLPSV